MKKITIETVMDGLRAAVAEKGRDFVYDPATMGRPAGGVYDKPQCVYSKLDGSPSCIFGHAFHYIDPELTPSHWVAETITSILRGAVGSGKATEQDLPAWFRAACGRAQSMQDRGEPWGEVLDLMEEYVRDYAPELAVARA